MRVAIVDDDRDEHVLLAEVTAGELPDVVCEGFTRFCDFLAAGPDRYDHIFLDRCLPPDSGYEANLGRLEAARFQGHVILMSACVKPVETGGYCFSITGPVDKYALLDPRRIAACLGR